MTWIATAAFVFFVCYLIYLFGRVVYTSFNGATDTVKAAIIGAFVSIFALFLGRYFEQKREAKQRISAEKILIYRSFFDFYFDLMTYEKIHGRPKPPEELLTEMLEFQKNIEMWAPDTVIKAYLEFKRTLAQNSQGKADSDLLPIKLALMMSAVAKLLTAMRRDLGYSFTSFSAKDLAELQLADDIETRKIYDHL